MDKERIARICHEVHRAYCTSVSMGRVPPWEELSPWSKELRMDAVEFILSHPGAVTPKACHAHWCKKMVEAGWTFGQYKDVFSKRHPSIGQFDQLTEKEQAKDYIFVTLVNQLANA